MISEKEYHYIFYYDGLKINTYKHFEDAKKEMYRYIKLYGDDKYCVITKSVPVIIRKDSKYEIKTSN